MGMTKEQVTIFDKRRARISELCDILTKLAASDLESQPRKKRK
jgi:hypothetical protein